ncbi:hypothetical protein K438DRAFT_1946403 [Mycena galopus ATCC 62051]|nr:hypothetical protein K438DRAFT_1946403 [Mycena galopus ATCC 62051]
MRAFDLRELVAWTVYTRVMTGTQNEGEPNGEMSSMQEHSQWNKWNEDGSHSATPRRDIMMKEMELTLPVPAIDAADTVNAPFLVVQSRCPAVWFDAESAPHNAAKKKGQPVRRGARRGSDGAHLEDENGAYIVQIRLQQRERDLTQLNAKLTAVSGNNAFLHPTSGEVRCWKSKEERMECNEKMEGDEEEYLLLA